MCAGGHLCCEDDGDGPAEHSTGTVTGDEHRDLKCGAELHDGSQVSTMTAAAVVCSKEKHLSNRY